MRASDYQWARVAVCARASEQLLIRGLVAVVVCGSSVRGPGFELLDLVVDISVLVVEGCEAINFLGRVAYSFSLVVQSFLLELS